MSLNQSLGAERGKVAAARLCEELLRCGEKDKVDSAKLRKVSKSVALISRFRLF